jgi:hypothetical protein
MSATRSRGKDSTRLTAKQRLALIHGTPTNSGTILRMTDEEINFDFFKRAQIPVSNYFAAGFILSSSGLTRCT